MTIAVDEWIWMPHPAHFIGAYKCSFRLATCVGDWIVSTVGEYKPQNEIVELGYLRKYETMVFLGMPRNCIYCPLQIDVEENMDFAAYNNPVDAYRGHIAMCKKWADYGQ
jgi:hypothetical protein